jgi:hypothetical protein
VGCHCGGAVLSRRGEDDAADRQRHFNPKQANIIVCDEDPTASLVEEARLSPEDLRAVGEDGLGETILARPIPPGPVAEPFA